MQTIAEEIGSAASSPQQQSRTPEKAAQTPSPIASTPTQTATASKTPPRKSATHGMMQPTGRVPGGALR